MAGRRKRIDYQPDDGDFALLVELAASYQQARDGGELYDAGLIALRMEATARRIADGAVLALDEHTPGQRRALGRAANVSKGALDHRAARARTRRDTDRDEQLNDNEEEY